MHQPIRATGLTGGFALFVRPSAQPTVFEEEPRLPGPNQDPLTGRQLQFRVALSGRFGFQQFVVEGDEVAEGLADILDADHGLVPRTGSEFLTNRQIPYRRRQFAQFRAAGIHEQGQGIRVRTLAQLS